MSERLTRSTTRVAGFEDGELDFQLLRQLRMANYGGASVGETVAAAAVIRAQGPRSWTGVFAALGERQRRRRRAAREGGPPCERRRPVSGSVQQLSSG